MNIKNLRRRHFQSCERTYLEEIDYLQTQSTHVFKFVRAEETPEMHQARINQFNKRALSISAKLNEEFTIRIDNSNYHDYELRRTSEGKWHIILHPNFDGSNTLGQNVCAPISRTW